MSYQKKIRQSSTSLPHQQLIDENKELRRQLKNCRDGLTCGLHPGMSCVEKHEADHLAFEEIGDWS